MHLMYGGGGAALCVQLGGQWKNYCGVRIGNIAFFSSFFEIGITFLVFNLFPWFFIYFGADGLEIYFLWSDVVYFCYNGPKSMTISRIFSKNIKNSCFFEKIMKILVFLNRYKFLVFSFFLCFFLFPWKIWIRRLRF